MTTRTLRISCGVAVTALVVAGASAALAHAAYKNSDPPNGSTVESPPSRLTAEFTEPLTDSSSLRIFDACGTQVDGGDTQVSGYEMTVSMSGDKAGAYTVEFTAQSALDSHTTSGAFGFKSSGGSPCPGSEPPPEQGGGGIGGGGSGGAGTSGDGGSNGGGSAAQDPASSGDVASSVGAGGRVETSRKPAGGTARTDGSGRRGDARGRTASNRPVDFQQAAGAAPRPSPAPWDLPLGGVVMAMTLCVMIGAAGGRVYAGIVAPARR